MGRVTRVAATVLMAAIGVGSVGCDSDGGPNAASRLGGSRPDDVEERQDALHSLLFPVPQACVLGALARVPALVSALPPGPGYGNWCGEHVSGPGDPVSCWDSACRVHDYAYGRWQDGFVSCHSVVDAQNMHDDVSGARRDTTCTLQADDALCSRWSACNGQVDLANSTWRLVGNPNAPHRECNPNPRHGRPSDPGHRVPTWCNWLNTWTCEDAFACPSPPGTFSPPASNCGYGPVLPLPPDESAADAIAALPEAATFCCQDYPQSVRDNVQQCQCLSGSKLDFHTLPSAQGWTYVPTLTSASEASVFSVDGTALLQNSIGLGDNAAPHYERPGSVDPMRPFTLFVRAQVLQEEIFRDNRFGFTVGATTDNENFDLGISSRGLEDENAAFFNPVFDATQFHDFRIEVTPGVGYQLFIDNAPAASGPPSPLGDAPRTLILGDESQNNARVAITKFEYCPHQ